MKRSMTPETPRSRGTARNAGLALILLAIGVLIGRSDGLDGTPAPAAHRDIGAGAAVDQAAITKPGTAPIAQIAPSPPPSSELPPTGLPPAEVLADLLPRARAGDASAACRVALELLACDHAPQGREALIQQLVQRENEADTSGRGSLANLLAANQIGILRHVQGCRDRPKALVEDGREWLERAARMGHEESQLRYALGQSLGEFNAPGPSATVPWGFLSSPAFERWRRDAPAMIQALVDRGSMTALSVQMAALSGQDGPYHGLVADDPAEAAALAMLHRRAFSGHRDESLLGPLSPGQRRRALDRYTALEGRFLDAEADEPSWLWAARAPLESILQSGAGNQPCR